MQRWPKQQTALVNLRMASPSVDAAVMMPKGLKSRNDSSSVSSDKGYDTADFVVDCWRMGVTPHIAKTMDVQRRFAIDRRTTSPAGYALSQRARTRIDEV
ncbi:hypothetical protein D7Y15_30905 [Corallococcus sp. AB030]|nr:hypothetical protein D7Y15_30905 [Corallococcus sp. AB030]